MIADLARPYRRPQHRWDGERRLVRAGLPALVLAIGLLILLATVAYGGTRGGGPERVTVAPGDTLWSIASAHGNGGDVRDTVDTIVAVNHLDGGLIHPGEILVVPAG
jgi:nucleoid-associated protein YgaU